MKSLLKIRSSYPLMGFIFYILTSTSSCFLAPKIQPSKRIKDGQNLNALSTGNFTIERSLDETELVIKFETKTQSFCQISYYPQDQTPVPAPSGLTWVNCKSAQPGRVFSETISSLDPKVLYVIAVKAWDSSSNAGSAKAVLVKENASPGDPSSTFVLQVDAGTGAGMLRAVKFSESFDAIKPKMLAPQACALKSAAWSNQLSVANVALPITRLSSKGFFVGATEVQEALTGARVINNGKSTAEATEWLISIQSAEAAGSIRFNVPPVLKDVSISLATKVDFSETSLDDIDFPGQKINSSANDATINWDLSSASESGVVSIGLVSHTGGDSIACSFKASDKTAKIPKDLISKLSKGRGYLNVRYDEIQQKQTRRWVVISSSWRAQTVSL